MEDIKKDCEIFGIYKLTSHQEDAIKYVGNAMFCQFTYTIWKVLACGVLDVAVLFWEKYCDCDLPITNSFWKVLLEYSTVRCPLVTFSLTLEETMPSS